MANLIIDLISGCLDSDPPRNFSINNAQGTFLLDTSGRIMPFIQWALGFFLYLHLSPTFGE